MPNSIKQIQYNAFVTCTSLEEIVLPEELETIGINAFFNCYNLKRIVIPKKVKEICNTFANCDNLEEVVLSEELENIGISAFDNCYRLKRIEIPKSVKKISSGAFANCENLEEVILLEGLEIIDGDAFIGCENLKRVVIPRSVKEISYDSFLECPNLEIYDQETNMRFINDINYNNKYKSIDEAIIELCSKYDIVKERLLLLASIRLGINANKNLNYDDEYNSFIKYCKNRLFVSLKKDNFKSQENIKNNSIDSAKNLIPWYAPYIPGFIASNDTEYVDSRENAENIEEYPKHNQELNIVDKQYKLDKNGNLWVIGENGQDDDIMPEVFVKEMKSLVKVKNYDRYIIKK